MTAEIRIGTSGWHYAHWRGVYYPQALPPADMLAYYARDFDTVEVNNSFYRLPEAATFAAWREATPTGFVFAVKASRYLTHMKKLKEPELAIARLIERVDALGGKRGPILFQLPPRWRVDVGRLAACLDALPAGRRYAFELRDPSWHRADVYALLERHGAALCIYDLAGFQSPLRLTADFTYVRLHGPGRAYEDTYAEAVLREWAERIGAWRRALRAIYVYFDNDQAGYAVRDALALCSLVEPVRT